MDYPLPCGRAVTYFSFPASNLVAVGSSKAQAHYNVRRGELMSFDVTSWRVLSISRELSRWWNHDCGLHRHDLVAISFSLEAIKALDQLSLEYNSFSLPIFAYQIHREMSSIPWPQSQHRFGQSQLYQIQGIIA